MFDVDVCEGIEETFVLNQEVIFRLLQYVYYMIMARMVQSELRNLGDKKRKFTSRKQLANGESISCSCFLYYDRYPCKL